MQAIAAAALEMVRISIAGLIQIAMHADLGSAAGVHCTQGWHANCVWLRPATPEGFGCNTFSYQSYSLLGSLLRLPVVTRVECLCVVAAPQV